ncbi:YccS family putative transporter [Endozoicomonas sp. SCSIO W0465]|uniref:YccS family putative transporter n=1 Tax=Endozoicomonas sp. SCSIO W0465 TaxID=2918516 RepID=UPI002075FCE2|nr:YccS family putative transporter [Endozoicomonas sp. SCSIO W0465]USE35106.1 YccS family putative transporter [Endozoicomonas sp. SCSIO W0465]
MLSPDIFQPFRNYWANDRINYSVKVFFALAGVTLPAWYRGSPDDITPMVLGIIAAALAEVDDNLWGRIKALIMMLACFLLASLSIELLFGYPLLFAAGLFCSTFGFTMLGAMGPRYSSMAFASLLLAVYTMLGAGNSPSLWTQPVLLLGGALWYGVLSLLWHILWPDRPVQQSLANVFKELAGYLDSKSQLFDPVANMNPQPLRLAVAKKNASVVNALNQAKASLLRRVRRQVSVREQPFLKIYFLAQDIHERVSSSHYRYQDLADHFSRSDILFRFQKVLRVQARACRAIAHSLASGRDYLHDSDNEAVLDELRQSLEYLQQQGNPRWRSLLVQLEYLLKNLTTVDFQISSVGKPGSAISEDESVLADSNPRGIKAHLLCIWNECRLDSPLFRHGLRLATSLTLGYGLILLFNLQPGYWVLLTILFVCQPSYSATRQKLTQRVVGTLAGLLTGIPLLYLFPGQEGQLVLMVISGILFFAFRTVRYDLATAFITLLVLFCFNQQGLGFAVMMPRLADTLLGCLLAVTAVMFILPDWESRRLNRIMALSIARHRAYLAQVMEQYQTGKRDTLAYRLSRRHAHDMDARLNSAIMNMLTEPGRYQRAKEESFRFLTLSHALLSYISTLGAHRMLLDGNAFQEELLAQYQAIDQHLRLLEQQLMASNVQPHGSLSGPDTIDEWLEEERPECRLLLQQLQLMLQIMPEMHLLAAEIYHQLSKPDRQ